MGRFYITTTLPYVNAKPHIGFATEIVRADAAARLRRLIGDEVFFNTGTDEHGQKIYQEAVKAGQTPQTYTNEWAAKFDILKKYLNLSYDNFIRTTDPHHVAAAQEFWRRCQEKGDIYKAKYKTKYCVGCELEKTDSELIDGKCPLHPKAELEIREEENYFFKFSNYQKPLLDFYEKNSNFVVPSFRQEEIKKFVAGEISDFSISRVKAKMPWGIDVPGDPEQVMYVWFEALINYISAIGWPSSAKASDGKPDMFDKFWPGVQIAGKDNLRQQTAMWQAMLMSAGLPNSKQIYIEGFITAEGGIKMSKSLGNVVDPIEYVEKYGTDAVRYYILAKFSSTEDSPITEKMFVEAFNSDLANGISNLVARVVVMAEKCALQSKALESSNLRISEEIIKMVNGWEFDKAMGWIWDRVKECDTLINERKVWALTGEEQKEVLVGLINKIRQIGVDLQPFLPETASKIIKQFSEEKIVRGENLFNRV